MEFKTFGNLMMSITLGMIIVTTMIVFIAGCEQKQDTNSDTSEDVSSNNSSESVQHKTSSDHSKQQVKPDNDEQTVSSEVVAGRLLEDFSDAGMESNTAKLEDAFKSLNNIYTAANENRIAMLSVKLANEVDNTIKTDKEVSKNGNR